MVSYRRLGTNLEDEGKDAELAQLSPGVSRVLVQSHAPEDLLHTNIYIIKLFVTETTVLK